MDNSHNSILLQSDTNELEIVEFRVDEIDGNGAVIPCYFGVNVAKVREIIRVPEIRTTINPNPCIKGMIKLRDKVITLIDLAMVLNKNTDGIATDKVIVLEFNRLIVGVLVHSVSRIYRISWEAVEPPVKHASDSRITGVVKMDNRIILLLDFEKIVGELCAADALTELGHKQLEQPPAFDRSSKRILVADDSAFIRQTICASLRSAGYNVDEAENGEEAWQMLNERLARSRSANRDLRSEVDLLITDIEMPKMDGLHLTSLIRKENGFEELPVVIFSSLASEDNKNKWKSIGASDILTKPDLPDLVSRADKLVQH
ncbi:chemotaxis protein [Geotalea sp. SG265]|uniref:chemotaxis protein CheV n=1 Tax=Geotalea sp. SG265 TaxID=2922867 RepID=UPI001FAF6218|nr:chemotaxis protein [Geotalea sp. SG265]